MTQTAPLVTVVVATYRSPYTLAQALRSIQLQTFERFEVIVVGDGDPDPSDAVVAAMDDPRFHYLRLDANSGNQATPNRAGCARARADWIAYLGHDDLWFPWHLQQLYACVEQDVDLVCSMVAMMAPGGVAEICGQPIDGELRRKGWCMPPSSWLHRKSLAERCGGWINNTSLAWAVDFDLLQRMTAMASRVAFVPRLGVMKFTSLEFGNYGATPIQPQADYLAELIAQPLVLERRVLSEGAVLLSRLQNSVGQSAAPGLYNGLRALWRLMRTRVVAYPWLARLWIPLFRWRRRISRRRRGLS